MLFIWPSFCCKLPVKLSNHLSERLCPYWYVKHLSAVSRIKWKMAWGSKTSRSEDWWCKCELLKLLKTVSKASCWPEHAGREVSWPMIVLKHLKGQICPLHIDNDRRLCACIANGPFPKQDTWTTMNMIVKRLTANPDSVMVLARTGSSIPDWKLSTCVDWRAWNVSHWSFRRKTR